MANTSLSCPENIDTSVIFRCVCACVRACVCVCVCSLLARVILLRICLFVHPISYVAIYYDICFFEFIICKVIFKAMYKTAFTLFRSHRSSF